MPKDKVISKRSTVREVIDALYQEQHRRDVQKLRRIYQNGSDRHRESVSACIKTICEAVD